MNNHFGLAFEGEMVVTNTTFVLEKFFINVFPLKDFLNWKNYLNNKEDSLSTYFVKQTVTLVKYLLFKRNVELPKY
jgi:hypothetical protein